MKWGMVLSIFLLTQREPISAEEQSAVGGLISDINIIKLLERKNRVINNSNLPANLLWTYQGIDDIECIAPITDVNGDGFADVLVESYDAGASGLHHFSCVSGPDGNLIWGVWPNGGPSNSGGWGDKCVAATSDLDGNGIPDALLGTAWGGRSIYAIDGDSGRVIWYYDTYRDPNGSGWVYQVNPMPDVDGDSIPEVLAAVAGSTMSAFCFSGANGSIIWRFRGNDGLGSSR